MASTLSSTTLRRAHLPSTTSCSSTPKINHQQHRNASLLRRPHRPYTFTQLITLSDGSTYTSRTTSPAPIFRSTKDTRNHPLWQPSLLSLRNIEQDEAGRLRAFRERFGRGWDLEAAEEGGEGEDGGMEVQGKEGIEGEKKGREGRDDGGESLMDLISGGTYNGASEGKRSGMEALAEAVKKAGKKGKK